MGKRKRSKSSSGEESAGRRGSDLTDLALLLVGLILIVGAFANVPVKLAGQIQVELPAPGALAARIVFGVVGAICVVLGLASRLAPLISRSVDWLQNHWRERTAAKPPARDLGVPPHRNPLFNDRDADLTRLADRLAKDKRVALSGLGGVGKSSLAIEYVHRHQLKYPDGTFWLRGETAATLRGDFAALGWLPPLQLEQRHLREQEPVVDAVARWLRDRERWLLVIDNLDEQATPTLTELLGRDLKGHVIVTAHVPILRAPLPVAPMPLELATTFLLDRTGQSDKGAATAVAEALGGLPLALEQAAAYMEASGRQLASYAELLRTRLGELMGEGKPADYPFPVASAWKLSFEQIEQRRPASAALLRLCAFLAPDEIPLSLFRAEAAELPTQLQVAMKDEVGFDQAVAELRRYSLVDRQGDGLTVHRLVQAVLRESFSDQRERWLSAAVKLLEVGFPAGADDPERWPHCARLLPHAQAVIGLVHDGAVEPGTTSSLVDRVARYLQSRGEYALARPLFERALDIRERVLGSDHPDTATSLNNLAFLLYDQGDVAAARTAAERALKVRERVLGPDHPATAQSLDDLGVLLQRQGELTAARTLLEQALEIRERALGP